MPETHKGRDAATNYLLGRLTAPEREDFEKQLLADPAFLRELSIREEELVDDYLDGDLTADERASFESHFLLTPARREQLDFARTLRASAARRTVPPAQPSTHPIKTAVPHT